MWQDFFHKLTNVYPRSGKMLWIRPKLSIIPLSLQRFDDPFLPFGKAVINATQDSVCGYIFDLASYLTMGGAGAVALERTIDYVADDIPTILHGAFDRPEYAQIADKTAFGVDAITISRLSDLDLFLSIPPHAPIVNQAIYEPIAEGGIWFDNAIVFAHNSVKLTVKVVGDEIFPQSITGDFPNLLRVELLKS